MPSTPLRIDTGLVSGKRSDDGRTWSYLGIPFAAPAGGPLALATTPARSALAGRQALRPVRASTDSARHASGFDHAAVFI